MLQLLGSTGSSVGVLGNIIELSNLPSEVCYVACVSIKVSWFHVSSQQVSW